MEYKAIIQYLQAVEVMEKNAINQLEVGSWIISRGLDLRDDLFPHVTGGFRGRMIPVASLEVRCNLT